MTNTTASIHHLKCKSLSSPLDNFEFVYFARSSLSTMPKTGDFPISLGRGEGVRRPIALTLSNPNGHPTGQKYRTLNLLITYKYLFKRGKNLTKYTMGRVREDTFLSPKILPQG